MLSFIFKENEKKEKKYIENKHSFGSGLSTIEGLAKLSSGSRYLESSDQVRCSQSIWTDTEERNMSYERIVSSFKY